MTSIEAILVMLIPTLKMFLSVAIALEATIQNNLSKSGKFFLVNVNNLIYCTAVNFSDI